MTGMKLDWSTARRLYSALRRRIRRAQWKTSFPELPMNTGSPVMDAYDTWDNGSKNHHAGTFSSDVLRTIEQMLPSAVKRTAETGCGKSTVLFSNISEHHTVFSFDDREYGDRSSVKFYEDCPFTKKERIHTVFGPTQRTLPTYEHAAPYDLVMLDGPHGWPFPELEYYFFYPHIVTGGLLILDDCHIPTLGRMADVLAEDAMWSLEGFATATAIFRRTDAPLFDPTGDGWWEQRYSRRRVSPKREIYLGDGEPIDRVSHLQLEARIFGDPIK